MSVGWRGGRRGSIFVIPIVGIDRKGLFVGFVLLLFGWVFWHTNDDEQRFSVQTETVLCSRQLMRSPTATEPMKLLFPL